MVDFVGLLKRTIDAQKNADQSLRQRIYERTRETVERQMENKNLPPEVVALQRRTLAKAIDTVEASYQNAAQIQPSSEQNTAPQDTAPPSIDRQPRREDSYVHGISAPTPQQASENIGTSQREQSDRSDRDELKNESGYSLSSGQASSSYPQTENGLQTQSHYSSSYNAAEQNNALRGSADYNSNQNASEQNTSNQNAQGAGNQASYDKSFASLHNLLFGKNSASKPDEVAEKLDQDAAQNWQKEAAENNHNSVEANTTVSNANEQDAHKHLDLPFSSAQNGFTAQDEQENKLSPLPDFLFTGEDENNQTQPQSTNATNSVETNSPAPNEVPQQRQAVDRDNEEQQNQVSFEQHTPYQPHSEQQYPAQTNYTQSYQNNGYDDYRQPPNQQTIAHPDQQENNQSQLEQEIAPYPLSAEESTAPYSHMDTETQGQKATGQHSETQAEPDVMMPNVHEDETNSNIDNEENREFAIRTGNNIASGIFSQAAKQEKSRLRRRRIVTAGAIILVLLIVLGGVFWILSSFFTKDNNKASIVGNTNQAAHQDALDKNNKRLTADGQEVEAQPVKQDAVQNVINGQMQNAEKVATGSAVFREAKTALMPETETNGSVNWSLIKEKNPEGNEDTVLRGELSIPDKDLFARLTFRPNHDNSIPAVYLMEVMFVVPENFEGGAIDKISPITFKATQQSAGQELLDMHAYKINNNFFVLTMNTPSENSNPRLQRNISLIEQLPWISMNVAYENGRIADFNFDKGSEGNALFKQFFEAQPASLGIKSAAKKENTDNKN